MTTELPGAPTSLTDAYRPVRRRHKRGQDGWRYASPTPSFMEGLSRQQRRAIERRCKKEARGAQ